MIIIVSLNRLLWGACVVCATAFGLGVCLGLKTGFKHGRKDATR